jgi:hypothetical protein
MWKTFPYLLLPSTHPSGLETLELNLGLCSLDRGGRGGVGEPTALLAVLERRGLGRAHTGALAVVGAASRRAVVVSDASARDELLGLAVTDVPGTGVVGDDLGKSRDGDYDGSAYLFFLLTDLVDREWDWPLTRKNDGDANHFVC